MQRHLAELPPTEVSARTSSGVTLSPQNTGGSSCSCEGLDQLSLQLAGALYAAVSTLTDEQCAEHHAVPLAIEVMDQALPQASSTGTKSGIRTGSTWRMCSGAPTWTNAGSRSRRPPRTCCRALRRSARNGARACRKSSPTEGASQA